MSGFLAWVVLAGLIVLAVGLFVYTACWCARAWPRIRKPPRSAFERLVYHHGVRQFGLLSWVLMAIGSPMHNALRGTGGPHVTLLRAGVEALVMLPLCLWTGYWWGRGMAAMFGVKAPTPPA